MWTTYIAPLGDRGTGVQNINRGQVSALSLPETSHPQGASGEKSGRGLCRPRWLSARTSSRASVPQLWVRPSELLEILEASLQRGPAFRGFHSAPCWLLA